MKENTLAGKINVYALDQDLKLENWIEISESTTILLKVGKHFRGENSAIYISSTDEFVLFEALIKIILRVNTKKILWMER